MSGTADRPLAWACRDCRPKAGRAGCVFYTLDPGENVTLQVTAHYDRDGGLVLIDRDLNVRVGILDHGPSAVKLYGSRSFRAWSFHAGQPLHRKDAENTVQDAIRRAEIDAAGSLAEAAAQLAAAGEAIRNMARPDGG